MESAKKVRTPRKRRQAQAVLDAQAGRGPELKPTKVDTSPGIDAAELAPIATGSASPAPPREWESDQNATREPREQTFPGMEVPEPARKGRRNANPDALVRTVSLDGPTLDQFVAISNKIATRNRRSESFSAILRVMIRFVWKHVEINQADEWLAAQITKGA